MYLDKDGKPNENYKQVRIPVRLEKHGHVIVMLINHQFDRHCATSGQKGKTKCPHFKEDHKKGNANCDLYDWRLYGFTIYNDNPNLDYKFYPRCPPCIEDHSDIHDKFNGNQCVLDKKKPK